MIKTDNVVTIQKIWGSELILTNDDLYCGKILTIIGNHRSSKHYHELKTETFYFMSGQILLEIWQNGEVHSMKPKFKYIIPNGISIKILPNTLHRFSGIDISSTFIEISTKDRCKDSYRLTESEYIENGSIKWGKNPLYSPLS